MSLEIERKWLLNGLPKDGESATVRNLFTTYISIKLDRDGDITQEVRVRRDNGNNENYWRDKNDDAKMYWNDKLTVKSGGGMTRSEIETEILDDTFFEHITFSTHELPIHKVFRSWMKDGHRIEFSDVEGEFYYAEVEFENEEDARNFVWPYPEVLIREVTDESEYKMANYWLKTRHGKTSTGNQLE